MDFDDLNIYGKQDKCAICGALCEGPLCELCEGELWDMRLDHVPD